MNIKPGYIGGPLELDLSLLGNSPRNEFDDVLRQQGDCSLHTSGRGALSSLLRKFDPQQCQIITPDYFCFDSMGPVIEASRIPWRTYIVQPDLKISTKEILKQLTAPINLVVIINYFGMTDTSRLIARLRQQVPNAIIILDNVQAYYEITHASEYAVQPDYTLYSLRKFFPVPDGAMLFAEAANTQPEPVRNAGEPSPNVIPALLASILRHSVVCGDTSASVTSQVVREYMQLYKYASDALQDSSRSIATLSRLIMNQLPLAQYQQRRRDNYRVLYDLLANFPNLEPLTSALGEDDYTPLVLPVW